jgi:hypothetical protein
MTLVIGTDEAGYGPNLGPLVIGATAWQIDATADDAEALLDAATGEALRDVASGSRVVWRDSKEVYRGGAGRPLLTQSAMTALCLATSVVPRSWQELAAAVGQINPLPEDASPEWQALTSRDLLDAALASSITLDAEAIAKHLASRGVRLQAVRCRCVYPGRFNQMLDRGLNKSDILSQETLGLAASLATSLRTPLAATRIWCDRHGGRKRYGGVITAAFSCRAAVLEETAEFSAYQLTDDGLFASSMVDDTRLEFAVRSERRPPVAVASLTAKLICELAMECFNDFWCGQLPGLAATAGYPVDAVRWREQSAPAVQRLGVNSAQLWRQV